MKAPVPVAEQSWAATLISFRNEPRTEPMWIEGTPTTTSHQAGMAPAPFKVATRAAVDSFVPLHFQLPPMRYCLPG